MTTKAKIKDDFAYFRNTKKKKIILLDVSVPTQKYVIK